MILKMVLLPIERLFYTFDFRVHDDSDRLLGVRHDVSPA